jgi:hypothetical protein
MVWRRKRIDRPGPGGAFGFGVGAAANRDSRTAPGGGGGARRVHRADADPVLGRGRVPPLSRRRARRPPGAWLVLVAGGRHPVRPGAAAGDVQSDTVEPICPESDPLCAAPGADEGAIVVHRQPRAGARQPPSVSAVTTVGADTSNPNITNNQMRNVEEGDIVKQIGHHLLVLQDGRIFVIDIRGGGGGGWPSPTG